MKRISVALALLCAVGAAPAQAATLYAFQSGNRAFTYVSPSLLSTDSGDAFSAGLTPNSCYNAGGACTGIGFDLSPSINLDRDVVAFGYGSGTGYYTFAAGALSTPGFYRAQAPAADASLLVVDIGNYRAGSVGYVFANGGRAFAYLSQGLLAADTGDAFSATATPTVCYNAGASCTGIGFDLSPSINLDRDVVAFGYGSGTGYYTFAAGALSNLGFYAAQQPAAGARLQVFALPGGIAAAGVPEPATWASMIFGFGLPGSALRRRARHRARPPAAA